MKQITQEKPLYFRDGLGDVYTFMTIDDAPVGLTQITEEQATTSSTLSLNEALAKKMQELAIATDKLYTPTLTTYSEVERQSWTFQEMEATAYLAKSTTDTPTIDAIYTGNDKAAFCNSVLEKAAIHKASLKVVGASQDVRYQLKVMTLDELIDANPSKMLNSTIGVLNNQ